MDPRTRTVRFHRGQHLSLGTIAPCCIEAAELHAREANELGARVRNCLIDENEGSAVLSLRFVVARAIRAQLQAVTR